MKMVHYLIEFRFQGIAKKRIKSLIWDVDKKCRIGNAKKKRPIPHITLVAPFTTKKESKLISDFNKLCTDYPLMKFTIKGFSTFENNRVVYLDIKPCKELNKFRWKLSKKLRSYCKLKPLDYKRKYYFHSTIAMKLEPKKFKQVKNYIKTKPKPDFKHVMVRATLLKGQYILREYDFLLRQSLTRKLAKSRNMNKKTTSLLTKYFEGKFNPNKNIKKSLWRKIKTIFS
ncbi:2'-5' RNA ligase family protein [Candidatus Woesearchaeota archaeon]|nr:2'-5' RNA ligase family protein [Candidatus Woesearchaeota archaeon]